MEPKLTDAERARLCVEFAVRAREVRASLDELAERLAGNDAALRAQLRIVERFLW